MLNNIYTSTYKDNRLTWLPFNVMLLEADPLTLDTVQENSPTRSDISVALRTFS